MSYSNFEAARAMTLLLARRGYRHIGFVTLPLEDNVRSVERKRGYLAGLAESGLVAAPSLILEMPGGVGSGAKAIGRLHDANPELDAVFFAGDVLAVGAILECQRRNWAVPGRIAIASFDDVDLLSCANPPVTTVRIPRYDIGQRSAEVLLERLSAPAPKPARLDLAFQIIERGST